MCLRKIDCDVSFIVCYWLLQVGVKTIVVYVNKADTVNDPEMLELVCSVLSCDHYRTVYNDRVITRLYNDHVITRLYNDHVITRLCNDHVITRLYNDLFKSVYAYT